MAKFLHKCPICKGRIMVTRYYCPECQTSIEGSFELEDDPFQRLTNDQRGFLLTFVRTEGRLNRMEEILGISYPTLKNRLTEVIHALGFEPEKETPRVVSTAERQEILSALENGKINPDQALRFLQGDELFFNDKE